MLLKKILGCILLFMFLIISCKNDTSSNTTSTTTPPKAKPTVKVPKFHRDSAYLFIEKQVSFGPRVPNTEAHKKCKDWLVGKFKELGAEVIEQDFEAKSYQNKTLQSTNIIAQYNPEKEKRIMLSAHWDSRHVGDYDPDPSKQDKPILGADDGASGVGILIEIARQIQINKIDLGVDIILFDVEDQGEKNGSRTSWCLGSQYWARHIHRPNYKPKFGILLDMVGSKNASFGKDDVSMKYAAKYMNKVWKLAKESGYGNYFKDRRTGGITDDHVFVNEIAKIPMLDIINQPEGSRTGFGDYWHTHNDDMSVIDKSTLRAVGQTLLSVLYKESVGIF